MFAKLVFFLLNTIYFLISSDNKNDGDSFGDCFLSIFPAGPKVLKEKVRNTDVSLRIQRKQKTMVRWWIFFFLRGLPRNILNGAL